MSRWRHAGRLLDRDPALAAEQATEILKVVPGHPGAVLILGIARRAGGDAATALGLLRPLAQAQPRWAAAHYELGLTLGSLGHGDEAVAALRRCVQLNPELPDAWRALADHLDASGDRVRAEQARARFLKASTRDPRLLAAGAALCDNRIPEAEALLRRHLLEHPTDIAALRMLAEVAARLGRLPGRGERCWSAVWSSRPHSTARATTTRWRCIRQGKHAAALPQVERLLESEPRNPNYRSLHAAVLAGIGEYARATRDL